MVRWELVSLGLYPGAYNRLGQYNREGSIAFEIWGAYIRGVNNRGAYIRDFTGFIKTMINSRYFIDKIISAVSKTKG